MHAKGTDASGPTDRTISLDDLKFAVGFQEARRWMAVPAYWPGALFNRLAIGDNGPNTNLNESVSQVRFCAAALGRC